MKLTLRHRCLGQTAVPGAAASFFFAVLAVLTASVPSAWSADPIFPTGSRLGLVPPHGMATSRTFEGFEDTDKNAAILFTTLPAEAYEQLDKTMVPDAMKKQGIDVDKREPIEIPAGRGFLLTGKQATDKGLIRKWLLVAAAGDVTALVNVQVPEQDATYSDQVVRAALQTLAVRAHIPDAEQLSLIPFKIGDLAGFNVEDVIPGRAIMLIDNSAGHNDQSATTVKTRMFIAAQPGGPEEPGDRGNFARVAFDQIVGIKDVHIQDAEPLRISNQAGYQTLAKATDIETGNEVMVIQWLRFGSGGFLRMIGIAHTDGWVDTLSRLRAVRDSIETN